MTINLIPNNNCIHKLPNINTKFGMAFSALNFTGKAKLKSDVFQYENKNSCRSSKFSAISFTGNSETQDVKSPNSFEFAQKANNSELLDKSVYNDSKEFALKFHEKLKNELIKLDENDIENIIQDVSEESGLEKEEVAEILARLTQFSSYDSFSALGDVLINKDVHYICGDKLRTDTYINSVNSALSYGRVVEKMADSDEKSEQMAKNKSVAIFIDEYSINHLKKLKETDPEEFARFMECEYGGKKKFYLIDSWNIKVGDKYHSWGMFDKSADLKTLTSAVASRMVSENCSTDEALNGDIIKDAKKALGEDIQIEIVGKEPIEGDVHDEIAKNVIQKMPTPKNIENVIEYCCNANADKLNDLDSTKANLMKYFDEMTLAISMEGFAQELKTLHGKIVQEAKELGFEEDDIYYLVPWSGKSFASVAYQYMKVNDISPEKFFQHSGFKHRQDKVPESDRDRCFVILDDFIGSGKSIAGETFSLGDFAYSNLVPIISKHNNKLIIGSLVFLKEGAENIMTERWVSKNNTKIITNHLYSYPDFAKTLTKSEQKDLDKALIHLGYETGGASVAFPYMNPDNNSKAGNFLGFFFNGDCRWHNHGTMLSPEDAAKLGLKPEEVKEEEW